MTRLHTLFEQQGQTPWLTHLSRSCLRSGRFDSYVRAGVRGVGGTSIVFADPQAATSIYDPQIASLVEKPLSVEDIYWELVIADVTEALSLLAPLYDTSEGNGGFVCLDLPPILTHDTTGIIATAESLWQQIGYPNLLIGIPVTDAGISAIRQLTTGGISTNGTQIFSLDQYEQVIEAYMSGLETCLEDVSAVHSVAAFSLNKVDDTVDALLQRIHDREIAALIGRTASCQAKQAYQMFMDRFSSSRWKAISCRGAHVQQPVWVSDLSEGDPYRSALHYVDELVGPNTIVAMSEHTLTTFERDGGALTRTLDNDIAEAADILERLAAIGVNLVDLAGCLEADSRAVTTRAYETALASLRTKAALLSR